MDNFLKSAVFKLWVVAIIYIPALVLSLGFIFPNSHFPVLIELLLKGTAILAFGIIVLMPVLYVGTYLRQKKRSQTLIVAAYTTVAGYALLFGQLLYVKLKTCDINAIPHDSRWHCNVSGKGVVVYFIAIPILAGIIGLLSAGIGHLSKTKSKE